MLSSPIGFCAIVALFGLLLVVVVELREHFLASSGERCVREAPGTRGSRGTSRRGGA